MQLININPNSYYMTYDNFLYNKLKLSKFNNQFQIWYSHFLLTYKTHKISINNPSSFSKKMYLEIQRNEIMVFSMHAKSLDI